MANSSSSLCRFNLFPTSPHIKLILTPAPPHLDRQWGLDLGISMASCLRVPSPCPSPIALITVKSKNSIDPFKKISTHSVKEVFPREPSTPQDKTESLVDQSWRVYLYVAERNFLKERGWAIDRIWPTLRWSTHHPRYSWLWGEWRYMSKIQTRHWRDCQFKNVCWLVRHYSRFSWLEIATEIQVSSYIHTKLMISLFPPACNPRFPNSKESYSLTGGF